MVLRIGIRVRCCHVMGESESEIISALALEHDENEEYCAPLTMSTQCGEVEEGAKPEPGKSNEEVMCGRDYSHG